MPICRRVVAGLLLATAVLVPGAAAAEGADRARIGASLGTPVYRDQLTGATDAERSDSARTLLVAPALHEYFQAHRTELTPTDAEVAAVAAQLDAAAACAPAYTKQVLVTPEMRVLMAKFLLASRGALRHVQSRFGGGRLLFQQGGVEAFDAMRRLVERLEAEGRIAFDDPAVRALAYDYWTRDPGPWAITDEAAIRDALDAPIVASCPPTAAPEG